MSIESHSDKTSSSFERIFPSDVLSKRSRVEKALSHQSLDRVPIHEQLSYNPGVISLYTGKQFEGFDFSLQDVGDVIRKTLDICFPLVPNKGTGLETSDDGFVFQNENWMTWRIDRPFEDENGAAAWLQKRLSRMEATGMNVHTAVEVKKEMPSSFDAETVRDHYRDYFLGMQDKVGETVIMDFSCTGFCDLFDAMGLDIFTFFSLDHAEMLKDYMELSLENELKRVEAVADPELSPVILIPEDFSTKQGPIFRPDFLDTYHYPYVKKLTRAWHDKGFKVIYHSDGNYKSAIPSLIDCGVDGFYCLEPNCGMHTVELKSTWPEMVWMGGINGVDTLEFGTPNDVRSDVHRDIIKTNALNAGGLFIASSSEINPPIPPENFKAMVDAVGELVNEGFRK
ncbi:MAG: hypothetical protein JXM70_08245 [Pirellulales bacterium]|nr:hypothetical protein [Pirellulales bacterium]